MRGFLSGARTEVPAWPPSQDEETEAGEAEPKPGPSEPKAGSEGMKSGRADRRPQHKPHTGAGAAPPHRAATPGFAEHVPGHPWGGATLGPFSSGGGPACAGWQPSGRRRTRGLASRSCRIPGGGQQPSLLLLLIPLPHPDSPGHRALCHPCRPHLPEPELPGPKAGGHLGFPWLLPLPLLPLAREERRAWLACWPR